MKHKRQTDPFESVAANHRLIEAGISKIERREWWLWASAILVTLLLTMGMVSFLFPMLSLRPGENFPVTMTGIVRGLVALVLLFDLYSVYQQLQIHRIRRRLTEREELFRLISENAVDMIAVVDAQGRRIYNSPAYLKILGYSAEDLEGTSSWEQIHPEDRERVRETATEVLQGAGGRGIEYRMRHKDGTWRLLESTSSTILNEEGEVEKLVIVNRDITARRQLEDQFRQAQKMEAVGRLSGGIAHDFNNLLGVIIGYGEILEEELEPGNPLRGNVEEILRAGERAAALTRQLLAFSRQQVLEPKVLDLNAVILDTENMLRRLIGEDVDLAVVLDPELGRTKADQGQLGQIIMNLAVNARDAMVDGGKLTIMTSNMEMNEAFVRRYSYPVQPGKYVLLTVTDTGSGMDEAIKTHLFEPFFTTKEKGKGTGLGLATVYGIVKQSGGYIDVESEVGVGTTFKIYLRRVEDALAHEKPARERMQKSGAHETVLLAEDEGSLRNLTRHLLEMSGYTVLEAKDGAEAIEISQRHQGPLDLLLTDMVMPGISGRVLADQLTGQRPQLKVVFMSGYTGQGIGNSGAFAAGTHFVQKPFTRDGLARKIREALDGDGTGRRKEQLSVGTDQLLVTDQ